MKTATLPWWKAERAVPDDAEPDDREDGDDEGEDSPGCDCDRRPGWPGILFLTTLMLLVFKCNGVALW